MTLRRVSSAVVLAAGAAAAAHLHARRGVIVAVCADERDAQRTLELAGQAADELREQLAQVAIVTSGLDALDAVRRAAFADAPLRYALYVHRDGTLTDEEAQHLVRDLARAGAQVWVVGGDELDLGQLRRVRCGDAVSFTAPGGDWVMLLRALISLARTPRPVPSTTSAPAPAAEHTLLDGAYCD